jgi:hypothetical protein
MDIQFDAVAGMVGFIFAAYAMMARESRTKLSSQTLAPMLVVTLIAAIVILSGAAASEYFKWDIRDHGSIIIFFSVAIIAYLVLGDLAIGIYYSTSRLTLFRRVFQRAKMFFGLHSAPSAAEIDVEVLKKLFQKYFYHTSFDDSSFLSHAKRHRQSIAVLATKSRRKIHHSELAALVVDCLKNHPEIIVQYVACAQHIGVFVDSLVYVFVNKTLSISENHSDSRPRQEELEKFRDRLVLVDAHTKHFGFDEEVYYSRNKDAKRWTSNKIIVASRTFPGVHTALARGFKKARRGDQMAIVIIDEPSSLADVDSSEQFRLFIRHVVSSEHLLGGILTIIYERPASIASHPQIGEIVDHHFDFHGRYDVAFPRWQISDRIVELADEILVWVNGRPHERKREKIALLTILNGGKVFAEELKQALNARCHKHKLEYKEIFEEFEVKASKYGESTDGSRQVRLHDCWDDKYKSLRDRIVL